MVVRGTSGFNDVLADMLAVGTPFTDWQGGRHLVHGGMMEGGTWLAGRLASIAQCMEAAGEGRGRGR